MLEWSLQASSQLSRLAAISVSTCGMVFHSWSCSGLTHGNGNFLPSWLDGSASPSSTPQSHYLEPWCSAFSSVTLWPQQVQHWPVVISDQPMWLEPSTTTDLFSHSRSSYQSCNVLPSNYSWVCSLTRSHQTLTSKTPFWLCTPFSTSTFSLTQSEPCWKVSWEVLASRTTYSSTTFSFKAVYFQAVFSYSASTHQLFLTSQCSVLGSLPQYAISYSSSYTSSSCSVPTGTRSASRLSRESIRLQDRARTEMRSTKALNCKKDSSERLTKYEIKFTKSTFRDHQRSRLS